MQKCMRFSSKSLEKGGSNANVHFIPVRKNLFLSISAKTDALLHFNLHKPPLYSKTKCTFAVGLATPSLNIEYAPR
ncbi:hypothetical protein NYE76_27510, partial [Paenibacillus sp. FSL M7-0831]